MGVVVESSEGFRWVNERPDATSENDEKWGWIGADPGDWVELGLDSRTASDGAGDGASVGASCAGGQAGGPTAWALLCRHQHQRTALALSLLPPTSLFLPCMRAEDVLLPVLNARAHKILNSYNHLGDPVTQPVNVSALMAGLPDPGALRCIACLECCRVEGAGRGGESQALTGCMHLACGMARPAGLQL